MNVTEAGLTDPSRRVLLSGGVHGHRYRDGEAAIAAHADDYAFLADGLIALHRATGDKRWLDEARRLLGGVLEPFTEGHDTADLRAAREQMAQLSRAD